MTDERALYDVLHETLDRIEVSEPFQRLQLQLEMPAAARRHRGRRIVMTRNRTILLAAALVALVALSVLASTRLFPDYRNNSQTPAATLGIDQAVVTQLRARPLALPVLKAGAQCPTSPYAPINYGPGTTDFGAGPVYVVGSSPTSSAWGNYFDVKYVTGPSLQGPVLIRARDLRTNETVVFVGPYASGSVVGSDTVEGKAVLQHADAVFDAANHQHSELGNGLGTTAWGIFPIRQGISTNFSHCFGVQFDGPGFTEIITSPNG